MFGFIGAFIVLMWSLGFAAPGVFAQSDISSQTTTIKGDLVSIRGDVYVVRDLFGRLVYLHVDKNTKRERLLMPGEKIEADVLPGDRAVALRPAK